MRDTRQLQHRLKQLRQVKTWQLVVVLILLLLVAMTLLRLNNLGMVERRAAVIAADKSGDTQVTQQKLVELQRYVSSHMNTSLGKNGVFLENEYRKASAAAVEAALNNDTNENSAAYEQASIECRERFQGGAASFRNDYVQCVVERVSALSAAEDPGASLQIVRPDTYRYNFVSPGLSFDSAGITVVISALIGLVIVTRLIAVVALRSLLKRRSQNI